MSWNSVFGSLKDITEKLCELLWGDLIKIPFFGVGYLNISILVLILVLASLYFTFRTRFIQFRMIPQMIKLVTKNKNAKNGFSGLHSLIVATATRVGMGNLAGVVGALSIGGAGSVFWMWIFAMLNSSLAFVESVLAQIHKRKDETNGGTFGGPAYYISDLFVGKNSKRKKSFVALAFVFCAFLCWSGVSQIASNSVSQSVQNVFNISPIYTSISLSLIAAFIFFKKNADLKVLKIMVPIMACAYFLITLFVILKNISNIPAVFSRIFSEAFGMRQAVGGGLGTVIITGAKRGIFSNEAGSGNTPNVVAKADFKKPQDAGLVQILGVFLDTLVCTCTALLILFVPNNIIGSLEGMSLLQSAMNYHVGAWGSIFITIELILFSLSTFLGLMFYAEPNIIYVFGNKNKYKNLFKIFLLSMLFLGGINSFTFIWTLADLGIGLMTIFNVLALFLLSKEVVAESLCSL